MSELRLTTEQLMADNNLIDGLDKSLKEWRDELQWVEKELIDQALIDAKQGSRSARYLSFEKLEAQLKEKIRIAEEKIGKVAERYHSMPMASLINDALKDIKTNRI